MPVVHVSHIASDLAHCSEQTLGGSLSSCTIYSMARFVYCRVATQTLVAEDLWPRSGLAINKDLVT